MFGCLRFKDESPILFLFFFSCTEILNGVIKSVRKDGEWKVTVDFLKNVFNFHFFVMIFINFKFLSCVYLGPYC